MKFLFNPNQEYQLSAISAVADLFEGQDSSLNSSFGVEGKRIGRLKEMSSDKAGHTLGYENRLTLNNEQLNKNLKSIQNKNQILSQENIESKGKNFSKVFCCAFFVLVKKTTFFYFPPLLKDFFRTD